MKRVLRLQVKVPKIEMCDPFMGPQDYWVPSDENALTFELEEAKVEGAISLYVDPEGVQLDWETRDWIEILEYPESCSQIAVLIEAECDDAVTEKQFLEMAQRLTHRYVNSILSYVRVELGQHWVRSMPISALYLVSFLAETKASWVDERGDTPVLEGVMDWQHPHPLKGDYYEFWHSYEWYAPYSPLTTDRWDDIHNSIQKQQEHSLENELIGNAKHHFESHQYRMAAVEAVTALEVGLSPFLRERCKTRGVSYSKLGGTGRGPGVAAYVTVLLPKVLGQQELDTWLESQRSKYRHLRLPFRKLGDDLTGEVILNRCASLNALRNKMVHKGKVPEVKDIEDIEQGIEAAQWLLTFAADMKS